MIDKKHGHVVTARLSHPNHPKMLFFILFDLVGIEENVVKDASREDFLGIRHLPIARIAHLIAMKMFACRPQDLADIANLLSVATPNDVSTARELLRSVTRSRLAKGRRLVSEFNKLVKQMSVDRSKRW